MNKRKRAVVVLTCFDFESLQLTLISLENTLRQDDIVVIILNGINSLASSKVERISRKWAESNTQSRHVVRPLCSGAKAYFSIREILTHYEPLRTVDFICKIDDDVIPLKRGWLDSLEEAYLKKYSNGNVGFTTGLINNNNWGFNELLDIFDKRACFERMFNYKFRGSTANNFQTSVLNNSGFGTIWQEPFLAWWVHQWTSLNIDKYISLTQNLDVMEIPEKTLYSIGCIFFEKNFWLELDHEKEKTSLDEELLHRKCEKERRLKLAVMNQPMIHLFYFNQRIANRDILDGITSSLKAYYSDNAFESIQKIRIDELIINLNERFAMLNSEMTTFFNDVTGSFD